MTQEEGGGQSTPSDIFFWLDDLLSGIKELPEACI